MRLVKTDKVIEALQVRDIDSTTQILDTIGDRVTQYIASILRTELARSNGQIDKFNYDARTLLHTNDPYVKFQLSRGFVDSGQTFELAVAGNYAGILPTGTPTIIDTDKYEVDYEAGTINLYDMSDAGTFYRVTYTSGFVEGSGSTAVNVPEWLEVTALRYCSHVYHLQQAAKNTKDKKDRLGQRPDLPPEDVSLMLANKIHHFTNAIQVM